jgi:hypothetical protein
MARPSLFFRFISVFFCSLMLFSSVCFAAKAAPNAELEGILQKIESRSYRWIAIRSDVLVLFAGAGDKQAMCGGELLYQRLDERMLLSCVDTHKELMFVFRTFDRRFDLYLPSQNTVYHGSIFDLESSPDIESHLKARDLYRALKPLAVDPRHVRVERDNSAITSLEVFSAQDSKDVLTRKLLLTPKGDVRGEVYYDAAGRSATEIQRYDFLEIPGRSGSFSSIIYPKKITIVSPETQKGSAIFFSKVKALDTIDPLEFVLRAPYGTKEVFLEEENRRSQYSKMPAKTAKAVTPAPATPVNEMPVYLAKPIEVPAEKIARTLERKVKKVPAAKTPASAPPPQATPVKTKAPRAAPENKNNSAEADIVVEDRPSSGQPSPASDQTTLDPSVEPSAEMGKQ